MILGIEDVEKKLVPLVLEHTKRLGQVSLGSLLCLLFDHLNYSQNCTCCDFSTHNFISSLLKILEQNSDLKTQQSFEKVIGLLKTCKEGAAELIFR